MTLPVGLSLLLGPLQPGLERGHGRGTVWPCPSWRSTSWPSATWCAASRSPGSRADHDPPPHPRHSSRRRLHQTDPTRARRRRARWRRRRARRVRAGRDYGWRRGATGTITLLHVLGRPRPPQGPRRDQGRLRDGEPRHHGADRDRALRRLLHRAADPSPVAGAGHVRAQLRELLTYSPNGACSAGAQGRPPRPVYPRSPLDAFSRTASSTGCRSRSPTSCCSTTRTSSRRPGSPSPTSSTGPGPTSRPRPRS